MARLWVTRSAFSIALSLCAASAGAASDRYGKIYDYAAGDGLSFFGGEEYCSHSGYPASKLNLRGVDTADVIPYRIGRSATLLTLPDSDDMIYVRSFRERGDECAIGVGVIEFDDGSRWFTAARTHENIPFQRGDSVLGGDSAERLNGTSASEELVGFSGNDQLHSYAGNDILDGGEGDDTIFGYAGNDWLIGGPGNDDLYGDEDDDSYVFEPGSGYDVIEDTRGDIYLFFPRTLWTEVSFTRERDDLLIRTGFSGDTVRIAKYFTEEINIRRIEFFGSVWDETAVEENVPN